METLYKDALECVLNYISIVDLITYRRISKYFRNIIKIGNVFIDVCKQKLTLCGLNYDEFSKSIVLSNSVISGSFILQCLLSSKYNIIEWKSDIDVFVNRTLTNTMEGQLGCICLGCGFIITTPHSKFGDEMCKACVIKHGYENLSITKKIIIESFENDYDMCGIICSRKWNINEAVINEIILMSDENVAAFVTKDFDFSFCSSYFNGKSIIIPNLKSILERKCSFSDDYSYPRRDRDEQDQYIRSRREKTFVRILKYRERGFVVDITDKKMQKMFNSYIKDLPTYNHDQKILNVSSGDEYDEEQSSGDEYDEEQSSDSEDYKAKRQKI